MDTDKSEILKSLFDKDLDKINQITEKIIGCSYTVSNTLGCGFLEKVYENALAHELRKAGLKVLQQHEIKVYYDGVEVGKYIADLFVEDNVIVEVKAINALDESQKAQCLNYLKATGLKIGLLINFGKPRIEIKRVAL
jgi:GxxExxY protein